MAERTNEDIIRIVTKWQEAGMVHELTCAVDSSHLPLEAVERDSKVVLVCPTCGVVQEHIPAAVLGSEAVIDYNLEMMNRHFVEAELSRRRGDVWFHVAIIMTCLTVFPFLVAGLMHALIGGAAGAVTTTVYARRALRKIDALAAPPESRP